MRIVGPRSDWPARRRTAFEEPDITQVLDSAREAMLHMLSQGLRDATKQRLREARRRRGPDVSAGGAARSPVPLRRHHLERDQLESAAIRR
jgi:hypothetical protein